MALRRLLLLSVSLLAGLACSSTPSGECQGPQDCGGLPCCWRVVNVTDEGTACQPAQNACVPRLGVDTLTTRLCQTDADCTSGGITTALARCCQESTHPFKACLAGCP